jgi:predicted nucleic acid-binding protein
MIVVSDTSPLSNLFIIDQLGLLEKLYGRIIVPEAVMNELLVLEERGIDLSPIKNAKWIEVMTIKERGEINKLLADLDIGEAEAIVLAESLHADWLLMDETKGRHIAKSHG